MFQLTSNSHNGKILETYLLPHPPILLPEIGKGEEIKCSATTDGFNKIAERIQNLAPDTIIIITPHGPVFSDAINISVENKLFGSFENFMHGEINFEFENNKALADSIIKQANKNNIPTIQMNKKIAKEYGIMFELDHGVLVPLYFISKIFKDFKLVHITIGMLSYSELYRAGIAIKNAVNASGDNVVIIASGDLSHRLTKTAPAGFNEKGKQYDMAIVNNIKSANIKGILTLEQSLIDNAGECAHRPLMMVLGSIDEFDVSSDVLSYEGPFGVGYCTAYFSPDGKNSEKTFLEMLNAINNIRKNEDSYVKLARYALESFVKTGKIITPPEDIPEEMKTNQAGVFVSIKKDGQLRGCIGTISPVRNNIANEIIHNAISAGTDDPRFSPITVDELDHLIYSVDVLKEPEPIEKIEQLDVIKYGVIVSSGYRKGLLLPNLDGVDTPEEQVSIALQKAGISPDEKYKMQRFEVIRHN